MQEELLIPTPFGNILVRHKKEISPKRLEKDNIKVFIYGHTHVPECVKRKGIAYINPGSLAYPRSELGCTYMILDMIQNSIDVRLYSMENHKLLKRYRVSLVEVPIDEEQIKEEKQNLTELEELEKELDKIEQELEEIRSKKHEQ